MSNKIRVEVEIPVGPLGGWRNCGAFVRVLLGFGIDCQRAIPRGDIVLGRVSSVMEHVVFLAENMDEAVRFVWAVYLVQRASNLELGTVSIDGQGGPVLLVNYYRFLEQALKLVKRIPGRNKNTGELRRLLQDSLKFPRR